MAWFTWVLVGIAVLATILILGLRINRKKRTARMAVRLAEVYRRHGRFEVAKQLYQVPFELDQNQEVARTGLTRIEQGRTEPVMEQALVDDAERMLRDGRAHLQQVLEDRGLGIELGPLEAEDGPEGTD